MKLFGVVAALVGTLLLCVSLLSAAGEHPAAAQPSAAPQRPLVFVPGLLGSKLCRTGEEGEEVVVWGTAEALGNFPALALEGAAGLEIVPCGLIREISYLGIFSQAVYRPFIERLATAGYREGETLFVFDYDWRLSVFDNAEKLAAFVERNVPGGGAVDIVAHSMGGLIARTYALEEGGVTRIARLVSAGSPWRGSVQVFELLNRGWGLANLFMGGLEGFRRTVISFPSTFELMPSYDDCCGGGATGAAFAAASLQAWEALNWPGIAAEQLPDLSEAKARQEMLGRIVASPLPGSIEEAYVVGVDQRTPERFELETGEGEARLMVRTSWDGDGTVLRDSAELAAPVTYPTSFATHDAILNEGSVQDFVIAALAHGPGAALSTVPVRERSSILTALGEFVELIGVAVVTDQPIYRTGASASVTVHLRLGTDDPVAASAIEVSVTRPDGVVAFLPLTADPSASDPSVPLEQAFSAEIGTGDIAGALTVTVRIETGGAPREVTRTVPVVGG